MVLELELVSALVSILDRLDVSAVLVSVWISIQAYSRLLIHRRP
jgi:hypothetical protein